MAKFLISSQIGSRNVPKATQSDQRQTSEKQPLDRERKGRTVSNSDGVGAALGMTLEWQEASDEMIFPSYAACAVHVRERDWISGYSEGQADGPNSVIHYKKASHKSHEW